MFTTDHNGTCYDVHYQNPDGEHGAGQHRGHKRWVSCGLRERVEDTVVCLPDHREQEKEDKDGDRDGGGEYHKGEVRVLIVIVDVVQLFTALANVFSLTKCHNIFIFRVHVELQ